MGLKLNLFHCHSSIMDELQVRRLCNNCKRFKPEEEFPYADKYADHRPYKPYMCALCAIPEDCQARYTLLPKRPPMDSQEGWIEALYRWYDEDASADEKVAFEDAVAKRTYPRRPGEVLAEIEAQKIIEKVSIESYVPPPQPSAPPPKLERFPLQAPVKAKPVAPAIALTGTKTCPHCGQNKDVSQFGVRNGRPTSYCKACTAQLAKERRHK